MRTRCCAFFLAKGRPQDNPLIIHVPDSSWLERYCENVPPEAYALAESFWPGPLTMILPRKPIVPLRTTGGLETVGVRCPNHPITRAVIAAADVPIAAPSGNTSGRPSPTCIADMIEDMDGRIEGMFDGGPCAVGVESTIIDLTCTPPRLLRPGGLPLEALEAVLGHVDVDKAVVSLLKDGERPKAPGMKYRHYAPKAPVTVVTGDPEASARYIQTHLPEGAGVICFTEYKDLFPGRSIHDLGPAADKAEQARRVFDALREFDHESVTEIYAQCPDTAGLGLAVANRLKKGGGLPRDRGMSMLVIGITGPTGCGKTTLLQQIERRGGHIVDCDALYYALLASKEGAALRQELQTAFPGAFGADGGLRRKALGQLVFGDKARMAQLNEIVFFSTSGMQSAQGSCANGLPGGGCSPLTRSTCLNPGWPRSAIRRWACWPDARRASRASWRATV